MDHPTAQDLVRAPLLASLSDEIRAALALRFDIEQFAAGRNIVTEGDAGYAFYILAGGRAAVTHDSAQLRELGPGDYFGEIAILGNDGRRTATVTATEDTEAWVLFGTEFRVLQTSQPEVAEALVSAMQDRLAAG